MRTEDPRVVRLADYKPPDFLVDRVHLDIKLDLEMTRVTSRLSLRRNPNGSAGAPLVLDGDELLLLGVMLDAQPLDTSKYAVTPEQFTFAEPPESPFELEIDTELDPSAN